MKLSRSFVRLAIPILALSTLGVFPLVRGAAPPGEELEDALAATGSQKVGDLYASWKQQHEKGGGDRNVQIPLGYSRGLSSEWTEARGLVRLNLIDGSVAAHVLGLPRDGDYDVWLGASSAPMPTRSGHCPRRMTRSAGRSWG
jgi:hypothetical protein